MDAFLVLATVLAFLLATPAARAASGSEDFPGGSADFDEVAGLFEDARDTLRNAGRQPSAAAPAKPQGGLAQMWKAVFENDGNKDGDSRDDEDESDGAIGREVARRMRAERMPKAKPRPPLGRDATPRERDEYRAGMKSFLHSLDSIVIDDAYGDPPPPLITGTTPEDGAGRAVGNESALDAAFHNTTLPALNGSRGLVGDIFRHGQWDDRFSQHNQDDDEEWGDPLPMFQNEFQDPDDEPELTEPSDSELEVLQGKWKRSDYARQRQPSLATGFWVADVSNRTVRGVLPGEIAGIFKLRKSGRLWFRGYQLNLERSLEPEISVVWERRNAHGPKKADRFCWNRMTDEQYEQLMRAEGPSAFREEIAAGAAKRTKSRKCAPPAEG